MIIKNLSSANLEILFFLAQFIAELGSCCKKSANASKTKNIIKENFKSNLCLKIRILPLS